MPPSQNDHQPNTHQVTYTKRPDDGFAIRAKGLCKTYGDGKKQSQKQALLSVDLDIPIGQIFGLLGPNGAGKSTFINIMAGTVVKTAGSLCVWGTDIDQNPRQARANIGIVPQELNIDAYFTPRQTLEMTAGLFGVPKNERRSDEVLEMVGLSDQHTPMQGSFRVACGGGFWWQRRWCTARLYWCWTSQRPASMSRCAKSCGTIS